jgi:hypothetical protein
MSEEFIGGYSKTATDPVLAPTWATITANLPIGVGSSSVAAPADGSEPVTVWASGEAMPTTFSISSGSSAWSVGSTTCAATIQPGSECTVSVTNTDPAAGADSGTLEVNGPNGSVPVTLSVTPTTPRLSSHASHASVTYGAKVVVSGSMTEPSGHPVAAHSVSLQREPAGASAWTTVSSAPTSSTGSVSFSVVPDRDAHYRLRSTTTPGYPVAVSKSVAVTVTSVLSAKARTASVRVGKSVVITVAVSPDEAGQAVTLQIRRAGAWQNLAHRALSSHSRAVFTIREPKPTTLHLRAIKTTDSEHRGAHSTPVTIKVH